MHAPGSERKAVPDESEDHQRGFTLTEMLVVLVIILAVSAVALPTVIVAIGERHVVSAAQILQASIAGARDASAGAGAQRRGSINPIETEAETFRGLRFVPEFTTRLGDGTIDPNQPLVCSRVVPISIPPAYTEGLASAYRRWPYPASVTGGRRGLILEESPGHWEPSAVGYTWLVNPPTSWAWNIRAGDRVTFENRTYCVCGPAIEDNPERFVNYGLPGVQSPIVRTYAAPDGQTIDVRPEYLLLANGLDDEGDGYVDNGWDGIDNDHDGVTDEVDEWTEAEDWLGDRAVAPIDLPYRIVRRAAPSPNQKEVELPRGAVIDLTGWLGTSGRSGLVVDRHSGSVSILFDKRGQWRYDTPYLTPSAIGMDRSFAHFWIGSRADITDPTAPMPPPREDAKLLAIGKGGVVSILDVNPDDPGRVYLEARRGMR